MSIDLGKTLSSTCCPCPPPSSESKKPEKYYPSLYLENIEGLPIIPEEGTLTVRFKRRSVAVTKRDTGEDSVCLTIDVISIEDVKGSGKKRSSSIDAFDSVAKEVMSKRESEY